MTQACHKQSQSFIVVEQLANAIPLHIRNKEQFDSVSWDILLKTTKGTQLWRLLDQMGSKCCVNMSNTRKRVPSHCQKSGWYTVKTLRCLEMWSNALPNKWVFLWRNVGCIKIKIIIIIKQQQQQKTGKDSKVKQLAVTSEIAKKKRKRKWKF